ncbi:uncharacterized protein EAF01_006660 [Botrytis porri]|uniref:Uncharacterized protein n=1 Tax=Botrytis porri TaxID=87229 RepID=A0A4Z1K9V8_9HELO|nr:uncharacterized protein EAF01_006660 [Botrytis porri]KAF7903611.1 hypothetical protein EAF01_006660 [Botrytis porri]TGO82893.1 hypothetical protein BPOR_0738g00050 [Botrytis porri]
MSTFKNILPILLLALPMAMATVGSDYPEPPSDSQERDFNTGHKSSVTIPVIISVVILVVFVIILVTLTMLGSRRRRERRTQYAGKTYNRSGVNAAAPPYSVVDDVNLPAYSYAPANGETVFAQQSSGIAQPAPAHVSKDVV